MSYNAALFNTNPYYDDFNESKRFHRILFRPGYAVQARELTQLQTILQNQIQRFGDHVFENGSLVSGGQITQTKAYYVRINTTIAESTNGGTSFTTSSSNSTALAALIGNEISTNSDATSPKSKVIFSQIKDDDDVDTYHYVYYEPFDGSVSYTSGQNLYIKDRNTGKIYRITVKSVSYATDSLPISGRCNIVTTQPGIYFVDGYFVLTTEQKIVPYNLATTTSTLDDSTTVAVGGKRFTKPSARVGFTISDEIITDVDDSSLGDPASGYSNYAAPGADRYKKSLILSFNEYIPQSSSAEESNYSSQNFVEILRFESGIVTKKESLPDYAVLEDTLARRTYDESGNYHVDPFDIQIREHLNNGSNNGVYTASNGGDETKLVAVLDPGKAYINGYEFETISNTYLPIDKARTTDTTGEKTVDLNIGSYVILGATLGITLGQGISIIDSELNPVIDLGDVNGTTIGTARFKQFDVQSAAQGKYRFYLYDIEIASSGADFGDTKLLFTTSGATIGYIDSVIGINSSGTTKLFENAPDTLVIELPTTESVSAINSIEHDVQLTFQATASGGQVQVSISPSLSGDPILFPGDLGIIAPSLLNNRYFLIDVTQNKFIEDYSGITFTTSSGRETLTIDGTGITNGNVYRVLANCEVNNQIPNLFYRTKTLNASQTVSNAIVTYDSNIGITYASLGYADIYVVESILGASSAPGIDFTSRYYLDDGQRDNFYDHGRVLLKPGVTAGDSELSITFRRFTHSGDGPFIVDSYPVGTAYSGATFGYDNIPSFTSEKTGKTVSLRNCLDFRPVKNSSGIIEGGFIPVAKESMTASFTHYLPRIDKLILTKDKEFKVIKGVPSLTPQVPSETVDGMDLYILYLGSYTFNTKDVEIKRIENKRYTMKDIGNLDERISNLEYYTSLSILEQEANSKTFFDSNGNTIPKSGIIVDNFNGHEIGDVSNRDYSCSMDFEIGELRPAFDSVNIDLTERTASAKENIVSYSPYADQLPSAVDRPSTKLYMLEFEPVRAISNILSDSTINPNPTGKVEWYGNMWLSPSSDDWYYDSTRPIVKLNKEGANDAWEYAPSTNDNIAYGFGSQWNDWEFNWYGKQISLEQVNKNVDFNSVRKIFDNTFSGTSTAVRDLDHEFLLRNQIETIDVSTRRGIGTTKIPDSIIKNTGDRRINTSVQPYIKIPFGGVRYYANGLKPNTTVYVYANDKLVETKVTDSSGTVSGTLTNSNLTNGLVKSGDILLRIIDDSSNNIENATVVAESNYKVCGYYPTTRDGITAIRPIITRRNSVNSSIINNSVLTRNTQNGTTVYGLDNLSQNFTVDKVAYPKGLFTSSIDLLFSRIPNSASNTDDNDTNLPITIEIRPTVSGYPSPSKIIPGSIVTKTPSQITEAETTDFNTYKTTFTFEYPVYLAPGEYSVVIRTNSDRYLLYTGTIGNAVSTTTGERITRQPYVGPLFKPQNAGTVIPDYTEALAFSLNRCEFESSGNITFRNRSGSISSNFNYDLYRVAATTLNFGMSSATDQSLKFEIATAPEGTGIVGSFKEISVNETLSPDASEGTQIVKTTDDTLRLKVTLQTDDNAVSPVIDAQRLSFVAIKNVINESSSETSTRSDPEYNGELDFQIPDTISSTKISKSRYITKKCILDSNVTASDLRVLLDVNQPTGTSIQVFARVLNTTDTKDLSQKDYIELTPQNTFVSENTKDFREVEYKVPNSNTFGIFNVFSIKIVMHSSDQFIVPRIRDMRVIALA